MRKPEKPYVWPIDLTKYDRSAEVTKGELALLRKLVKQEWRGQHRRPHWFEPLSRILWPLQDAADAFKLPCGRVTGGLGFILSETVKRRRTIWGWTHEEWCDILRGKVRDFESAGLGKELRTGAMAIGGLLRCLGDVRDYGQFDRPALAYRIFGRDAVEAAAARVLDQLAAWRFGKSKRPEVMVCLYELLLINESPRLEDLQYELLERLYESPRTKSRKRSLHRVSLCLHDLGVITKPLPSPFEGARRRGRRPSPGNRSALARVH